MYNKYIWLLRIESIIDVSLVKEFLYFLYIYQLFFNRNMYIDTYILTHLTLDFWLTLQSTFDSPYNRLLTHITCDFWLTLQSTFGVHILHGVWWVRLIRIHQQTFSSKKDITNTTGKSISPTALTYNSLN